MPKNPPLSISPEAIQRILQSGGDPSAMFFGDPSQPTTTAPGAPVSSAPPSGAISNSMSGASPTQLSQTSAIPSSSATPASPAAVGSPMTGVAPPSGAISSSMSGKPPMTSDEFGQAKPDAYKGYMPAEPPPSRFSGPHGTLRRVLADLFAGTAEFGGDINHHPGQGAQFLNRWADEDQANQQYNANLQRNEAQAKTQAYNQYLEEQKSGAQTAGTQAQTSKTLQEIDNMRHNPPGKLDFLQKFSAALKSGEEDPHEVLNQYLRLSASVPGVQRQELVDLANSTPEVPPSFKIGEQGIAQPLRYHGQVWSVNHQIKADPKKGFAGVNLINEPNAPPTLQQAAAAARTDEDQVQTNKLQSQAAARSNIVMGQQYNVEKERNDKLLAEDTNLSDSQQRHDQLANAVDMAQKGNTIQAQNAVLKTLGLSLDGITKRINTTELAKFEQAGSIGQRIAGQLRGWTSGNPFPDSIWGDIKAFADQEFTEAQQKHDRNVKLINNRLGGPQSSAAPATTSAPPNGQQQAKPPGATHTAMGSDGKKHYTNAQGQDLGVAP
jgi:hypothetical protein